jgi:hypothetical protein
MTRAYARLGDFRKQTGIIKCLIVPYKISLGKFNYETYFKSIDVLYINFNDPKEVLLLQQKIEELFNI